MGQFKREFQVEEITHQQPVLVSENFPVVSKYRQYVLSFRHKARVWWTDTQNYDPQDRASIAASRGNHLRQQAHRSQQLITNIYQLQVVDMST